MRTSTVRGQCQEHKPLSDALVNPQITFKLMFSGSCTHQPGESGGVFRARARASSHQFWGPWAKPAGAGGAVMGKRVSAKAQTQS